MLPIASANAVPIEGTDPGDVAAAAFNGIFTQPTTDELMPSTVITLMGDGVAIPLQIENAPGFEPENGFATTAPYGVVFSPNSFALNDFAGKTFSLQFDEFTSGGAELDEFFGIPAGTFDFVVDNATLDFDPTPVTGQTSFQLTGTGNITVPATSPGFDPMPEYSIVLNGSIADGEDEGSISGTLTAVTTIPEPGTMALFGMTAVAALGAHGAFNRKRQKQGASA